MRTDSPNYVLDVLLLRYEVLALRSWRSVLAARAIAVPFRCVSPLHTLVEAQQGPASLQGLYSALHGVQCCSLRFLFALCSPLQPTPL